MDHDVKAVANVLYKIARTEGKHLTASEYQQVCLIADRLSRQVMHEPLFNDLVLDGTIPALAAAHKPYGDLPIRMRLETRTPPIKEESPAWKAIRMAWVEFDYLKRHAEVR